MVATIGLALTLLPGQAAAPGWKAYDLGALRMKALLPAKPVARKISLTAGGGDVKTFLWMQSTRSDVTFLFNFTEYRKPSAVNLKSAQQGALDALQGANPGVKLTTASKAAVVNGMPAIRFQATFDAGGEKMVYSSIVAGKGQRLWQVIATYSATPAASAAAARVLGSVSIKP